MGENRGRKVKTLLTDEREQNDLIEAYKSGMSWADMQKKYGISKGPIVRALKKSRNSKQNKA